MTARATVRLVLGDEELLVARAIAGAIAAERTEQPGLAVAEHAATEMAVSDLLAAVSPSLFSELRIVIIRDIHDAKKDLSAALLNYAVAPEPEVVLVLTHAGGAKAKALADGLREAGASVVTAAKITRHRDRVDFVRHEVRHLGGRCGDEAAEALIAAIGNDLRELAAACSQLVADTGGRVDAATVARYYRGRGAVSGFTVADAAMVGDLSGALEALRWAMNIGVDPVPIADALADGVRTVARVASAGHASAYKLAPILGLPPWKIERAQRQSRNWTPEGLAAAMKAAAECNAAVKGGADDRGYALERAVVAVAAARRPGTS